jgi:aspartate kinase
VGAGGAADLSFTVLTDDLRATLAAANEAAAELKAEGVTHNDQVAKVSVVGLGMARQTGVAERMFRALADAGVNIQMITTSEIKISVLVAREQAAAALRAVHQEFELDKAPAIAAETQTVPKSGQSDAVAVVARLQKMEELAIDDIELDEAQARITVSGVSDQPGIAATIFEAVARGGIFVDMIVQSFGREGTAKLSFTVPQDQYDKTLKLLAGLSDKLKCGPISGSAKVAKLSVSGIGLRSHTQVAIRTFRCLAESGINIDLISTSEVRVNVVVDGNQGKQALKCLQTAFADCMQ